MKRVTSRNGAGGPHHNACRTSGESLTLRSGRGMAADEGLRPLGASRPTVVVSHTPGPVEHADAEGAPDPPPGPPEEVQAARELVARLRGAWPAVAEAVVEATVSSAYAAFRQARVRAYVPILVERRARKALQEASGGPTVSGGDR